jgi:hypothetical protein
MKKFYFFIFIIGIIFQFSCSKDENLIVGEWEVTYHLTTGCSTWNGFAEFTNGCTTIEKIDGEVEICISFVFKDDGALLARRQETGRESGIVVNTEVQTILGSYKINGNKILICEDDEIITNCDDEDELDFTLTKSCLTLVHIDPSDGCRTEWKLSRKK